MRLLFFNIKNNSLNLSQLEIWNGDFLIPNPYCQGTCSPQLVRSLARETIHSTDVSSLASPTVYPVIRRQSVTRDYDVSILFMEFSLENSVVRGETV